MLREQLPMTARQRDLKWNPFLQGKLATFGDYLARQPFPPVDLYQFEGVYNRAVLICMTCVRLAKDVERVPASTLKRYFTLHAQHREGERLGIYLRPQAYDAIEEIGRALDRLPPDVRPAKLRGTRSYNRQLIITVALLYVADWVSDLKT